MLENTYLKAFLENVALKYQIFNGMFLTLPFENLFNVGIKLPVFAELCREELHKGTSPQEIVHIFFKDIAHIRNFDHQAQVLILLLQFVERQVVLFDALEDAAFCSTHNIQGDGTLAHLMQRLKTDNKTTRLPKVLEHYKTRIVLTAHPTQFYPPFVLNLIQDLTVAIQENNIPKIHDFLLQLGKTPFKNRQQPTPLDEADALINYLNLIFYPVLKDLHHKIFKTIGSSKESLIELGFWPGGDRDGNPNVTSETTLRVAEKLKSKILEIYISEIKKLYHRLTFKNVLNLLENCQKKLEATQQKGQIVKSKNQQDYYSDCEEFIHDLETIQKIIINEHQSLFVDEVEKLLSAAITFGFHFATLDLRQNSPIHSLAIEKILQKNKLSPNYIKLTNNEKIKLIDKLLKSPTSKSLVHTFEKDELLGDVISSLQAAQIIQANNGEKGLNRYIISHTQDAYNVLEVILLAHWAGWSLKKLNMDIVPLFESIQDLENAKDIMRELYSHPIYRQHLSHRNNQQTIMLGFSDGTKDGGYTTANWEIFKAKKSLTDLSKEYGVDVVFFDGRGGPPARGGGKTHQFYRAMENFIEQKQIQLTIQGQTISSNYGTIPSASYNIEELFTAGLSALLFPNKSNTLLKRDITLIESLSKISSEKYLQLKQHPLFMQYLKEISPLEYYGELNIASRPVRRSAAKSQDLEDLRAIPFVGAWSQMKQNIPGFYGLGSALETLIHQGKKQDLKRLYKNSLFVRTLFENSMQSLKKSNFPLTQYLAHDEKFGSFWNILNDEAKVTQRLLQEISGQHELLEDEPVKAESIKIREDLVLPLLVIQQYALITLRQLDKDTKANSKLDKEKKEILHNLVLKSFAANINASRNSA